MEFKPKISYDFVEKIWTSLDESDHFDPDLSIGEIIYHEMRRHPKGIAQVRRSFVCYKCYIMREALPISNNTKFIYMFLI